MGVFSSLFGLQSSAILFGTDLFMVCRKKKKILTCERRWLNPKLAKKIGIVEFDEAVNGFFLLPVCFLNFFPHLQLFDLEYSIDRLNQNGLFLVFCLICCYEMPLLCQASLVLFTFKKDITYICMTILSNFLFI